jgi:hypothetical protein
MARLAGEDKSEQKLVDNVAVHGWHCIHILAEGEHVAYSFTVGLFHSYGHPELIIFGLAREVAHDILTIAADAARSGSPIDLTQPTDAFLKNGHCEFAKVPASAYREHVGSALWYYETKPFPLYQIVWPSKTGNFPWEPEVSAAFREAQPVIGVPAS